MLLIATSIRSKRTYERTILTWYVGGPRPLAHDDISLVEEVQADGHELQFIAQHFQNLPMRTDRSVVIWFGDDARFIAGNL